MDRLDALRLFTRVIDLGSFAAAARERGISPSAASKAINELEAAVGAKLVNRTTRRIALTPAGGRYLERTRAILLALDEADGEAAGDVIVPAGRLRLNAPMALGLSDLGAALTGFVAAYPQLELDLELGDRHVDLVAEGFDLSLRATTDPKDSTYFAQRIAAFPLHVCASPGYLARAGCPETPGDLSAHACFAYAYATAGARWPLRWNGATHVAITPRARANNTFFLKRLVLEGLGIAVLPSFVAKPEIDRGELVDLFPTVERPPLVLYAIRAQRQFPQAKVLSCIRYLKDWFAARQT